MFKWLVCLIRGHDVHVWTDYEFDPDKMEHTWIQRKECLRCMKELSEPITTKL